MGKYLKVWDLMRNPRHVLLAIIAAMYVTWHMSLIICLDYSKSYNEFSFQKVQIFKNILRQQTMSVIGLLYTLGCDARELHFCTM